ncbi:reverse transcriptase family protein [Gluconobacter kondonii]|uniref:RNA-directed DNA polymerase n=1 Tax=Gluconobacter kondonii TaxID=941463 RepID=A0ABQ5WW87_9PROT|nr:reverse transcriptase family protein [Gluconobacter kondonii]GLQ67330.1 hypothetical protein GCM10007870_29150 [Gluconobacter kondonii]
MIDSIRTIASNFRIDVNDWRSFFEIHGGRQKRLIAGYLAFVEEMATHGLPPIFEGRHLRKLLGATQAEFGSMTSNPESHYRSFTIPKRNGGERTILTPTPLLLYCQRWIDLFILRKIPVHDAAHGYIAGRSNISNAKIHLGSAQLLSVDISNFFENVNAGKVAYVFQSAGYPPAVVFLLTRLCTYKGHLPQGAASSPQLSNLVMRGFDETLQSYANVRGLRYSRYVDDIVLSGRHIGPNDVNAVEEALKQVGLALNPKKIHFQRGRKKIVTGISIGSGRLLLPRELRRRYRNETFLTLKNITAATERDPIALERHLGQLAYWTNIEPGNERALHLLKQVRSVSTC